MDKKKRLFEDMSEEERKRVKKLADMIVQIQD